MLVFQLCPILNACTKNTVLVLCGLDETTATTKKHQKHDGWRVLGRRTRNNATLCWKEVARKSSAGAFWCFVEQAKPQQIERKSKVLVLLCALLNKRNHNNNKKAPKSTKKHNIVVNMITVFAG